MSSEGVGEGKDEILLFFAKSQVSLDPLVAVSYTHLTLPTKLEV